MTEERKERIRNTIRLSQFDLGVVLENVHDPHNVGAVIRTCDAVGVRSVYVLYTRPVEKRWTFRIGAKSARNVRKWVDVHYFEDRKACFEAVRARYKNVYATHLGEDSKSLYDLKLDGSVALLFGNEQWGVSEESLALCDGNFTIPMYGFAQSLNVSVSVAVSLYEAVRQRELAGKFQTETPVENEEAIFDDFCERANRKHDPERLIK